LKSNIVILGSGISGIGAAILASKQNYNVLVSDSKSIKSETKRIFNSEKYFMGRKWSH